MSSMKLLTLPFAPVLTVAKIFGLNSSASPTTTSRYLFCYGLIVVSVYLTVLLLRIFRGEDKQIFTINKVVAYLHLLCYTCVFLANIVSNWLNSRVLSRNFWRLELFDSGLKAAGFEVDYSRMRRTFYFLLLGSSSIYIYVAVVDLAFDGVKDIVNWVSIYIPFTINFFSLFVTIFILLLLNERYQTLKVYFEEMLSQERQSDVKKFTDFYMELTQIANSTMQTFSLQITAMFLLNLVAITSNAYMLLKLHFVPQQTLLIVNSLLIHCFEMVALICMYAITRAKAEDIVASSARLLTGVSQSKTTVKENMECYFLVKEHRFGVVVFGMFSLEPSVLLSMAASITSYLIVLIQFKDNEGTNGPLARSAGSDTPLVRHQNKQ